MNVVSCVVCGVVVEACCTLCSDPVCDRHALAHDYDQHGLKPEDVRIVLPHEADQVAD